MTTLLDLARTDRTAFVTTLTAAWTGSAAGLQLLIAAIEEMQRRDQESWDAIVEAEGLPEGGTWWSNNDIEARYNVDGTEGGWYLVELAHNAVGDDVIEQVSSFLAPGAVEGVSHGEHTTDILLPVTVQRAIAEGVPYMLAEVKPWQGDRSGGRRQLRIAREWAEAQGAEVVYVGAPDPETGEPQLTNPLDFANGKLEFPTSGSRELYPGMYVVYQLSEPGLYEYRIYVTEVQPDPDDPASPGSDIDFGQQLAIDWAGSESGRPTQQNVIANEELVVHSMPDGGPTPNPPPGRFAENTLSSAAS